ncbi:hypothetical protein [Streptomyces sp. 142MFCol3.1]|uniref:hypothetical protein n=1 Tax=Streptomyces sp. 142MFCol3.1 TaxID=1172179 RepID=UPI0003F9A353|nr:hypothetical protein [Streptomyces sp. 142MFCol3.1]
MTTDAAERHPLAVRGQKAEAYLLRVAEQHQRMGYGQMVYRREKASRWIRGGYAPSYHTQRCMHWRSQEVRWTAGNF